MRQIGCVKSPCKSRPLFKLHEPLSNFVLNHRFFFLHITYTKSHKSLAECISTEENSHRGLSSNRRESCEGAFHWCFRIYFPVVYEINKKESIGRCASGVRGHKPISHRSVFHARLYCNIRTGNASENIVFPPNDRELWPGSSNALARMAGRF